MGDKVPEKYYNYQAQPTPTPADGSQGNNHLPKEVKRASSPWQPAGGHSKDGDQGWGRGAGDPRPSLPCEFRVREESPRGSSRRSCFHYVTQSRPFVSGGDTVNPAVAQLCPQTAFTVHALVSPWVSGVGGGKSKEALESSSFLPQCLLWRGQRDREARSRGQSLSACAMQTGCIFPARKFANDFLIRLLFTRLPPEQHEFKSVCARHEARHSEPRQAGVKRVRTGEGICVQPAGPRAGDAGELETPPRCDLAPCHMGVRDSRGLFPMGECSVCTPSTEFSVAPSAERAWISHLCLS